MPEVVVLSVCIEEIIFKRVTVKELLHVTQSNPYYYSTDED